MKRNNVKVTEHRNKLILTINPILAQKSIRKFDLVNSTSKVHNKKKEKGSYTRKEKHKNRDCENNTSLYFLYYTGHYMK